MTSTNSSTHGPFYLVVLQLIIASKLSELEQFENREANYRIASRKGWKWEKIKLMLLPSFKKGVFWQCDVILTVKFNFKEGLHYLLHKNATFCSKWTVFVQFSFLEKKSLKFHLCGKWVRHRAKFKKRDPPWNLILLPEQHHPGKQHIF